MGFLDVEGMPAGTNWDPELRRALGNCQMLVALLSVPYLKSSWCGREWHAFESRARTVKAHAGPNQSSIIPVRWAPIPEGVKMPPVVADNINIFSPKATKKKPQLPQQYAVNGLFGLLHGREEDAANEIIWQLALLVQNIYYNQQLEPKDFEPDDLINVFEEEQE
jgi:hypothetical protein